MFRRVLSLIALAAPATVAADEPQVAMGQVTIHERIVVRVPRTGGYPMGRTVAAGRVAIAPPTRWKEHKGPHCIGIGELSAAAIATPTAVDLLLVDGRRLRARLERDCRSADFYSGLYIRPGADGRICADRDAIRVRSGAACEIDDFRLLEPR